ncbi:hypothetical protein RhiirA4_489678 [Rhizophagus irregularis]|uniref:Uncharacterized protein n=1 Tax=Rhizophagus irregularis TaxID=588596 RepID=A0A2I1HUZ7_9GLOM|nr:hypothetical protein RhiirA4_489678 [Rhizophagus irregularis]
MVKNALVKAREVKWKRKKAERNYAVEFVHKPLTQKGIELLLTQNDINICQKCILLYMISLSKSFHLLINENVYLVLILASYKKSKENNMGIF